VLSAVNLFINIIMSTASEALGPGHEIDKEAVPEHREKLPDSKGVEGNQAQTIISSTPAIRNGVLQKRKGWFAR
jgi:hypothetical protein